MPVNYLFPLPKANLHRRYDSVFDSFKKGLSSTLIGLPYSARSGYLKFILEYDRKFLAEFIDPDTFHFIVLEEPNLSGDQLIHSLAAKILTLGILTPQNQSLLESRLRIHDPQLTLIAIKAALTSIYPRQKLVIILYEAEKLLDSNPQSIYFLTQIWNTNRNQPESQISFCFIGSPFLLETKNQPHWLPIRPALEESIQFFPLFSVSEISYLRHRLEKLSGVSIPEKIHRIAGQLSSGHTVLYRLLVQLDKKELERIRNTHSHPSLDALLGSIWQGFPSLVRQNWSEKFLSTTLFFRLNCFIPLLPPSTNHRESISHDADLPLMTSQQKLVFDYLNSHISQIIARDEIAQVLWGKNWQEKYSDWAIDQTICKLKHKLSGTPFSLLTVRNRGYQLSIS